MLLLIITAIHWIISVSVVQGLTKWLKSHSNNKYKRNVFLDIGNGFQGSFHTAFPYVFRWQIRWWSIECGGGSVKLWYGRMTVDRVCRVWRVLCFCYAKDYFCRVKTNRGELWQGALESYFYIPTQFFILLQWQTQIGAMVVTIMTRPTEVEMKYR